MKHVDADVRHADLEAARAADERHVVHERPPAGDRSSRPTPVPHFTPAERAARGKAARAELPRSAHAAVGAGAGTQRPGGRARGASADAAARTRADPLRAHARVAVRLLPRRRAPDGGRPRGRAAHGALRPVLRRRAPDNFGIFAAPDRRLVFSLNDFDETLPGPFEWDVKRLAASFAVVGRERGFDDAIRTSTVRAASREYREAMARFAAMRNIHVWYARLDVAEIREQLGRRMSGKRLKRLHRTSRACARKTACERSGSCAAPSTASSASSAIRRW